MCGIFFAFEYKADPQDLRQRGEAALDLLYRRGPNEQNLIHQNNWLVGHTRLSIIDLGSSHQPMAVPEGSSYLSFNGEIYNFKDLRRKLEHVWTFTTSGDTEVLLAGLTLHGADFIRQLEGMWAFLFWDAEKQILLASRDPLGKKPLYYRSNQRGIYFASELAALKRLDPDHWHEDHTATRAIIKYGFTEPGATVYRATHEVKPGHNLDWAPSGSVVQRQYWELPSTRDSTMLFGDACVLLEQKIATAVGKRLSADVEVGAFLSGGIDSSIVALLAQQQLTLPLRTFTVRFADKGYDESEFARLVARQIGSQHQEIEVIQPTVNDLLELMTNSLSQPFGDPSLLPTHALCNATSRHVKVALSGDGADEVFSGYQRYQARVLLNWYHRIPPSLRRTAEAFLSKIPDSFSHHSRSLIKKAKEFSHLANSAEFNYSYIAPIVSADFFAEPEPKLQAVTADFTSSTLEEMMYRDMLIYLPQDILTKVDRASMYSSLEVRSPFLDIDLIETAFSLPVEYHRSMLKGKRLLRTIYRSQLPPAIITRRKQGFTNPIHSWFRGQLGDDIVVMNQATDSILSTQALEQAVARHRAGQRDMSLSLWNALSYLLWKTHAC